MQTYYQMEKPVNVALCAYGMSGEVFHAPILKVHPGFNLTKIFERSKNKASHRYPDIEIVRDFEKILRDREIELVVVNTPDNTHFNLGKMALLAGKHVVIEKPFTLSSENGQVLTGIAKGRKLVLSVFHNRRWDGDFLTVKRIVENNMLGRLTEFESHFDRYRNYIPQNSWKEDPDSGTDTVYNLGSHLIDQATDLFGMPKFVNADIRMVRNGAKVDDSFEIRLGYTDVRVILKGSYLVRQPGPRFILHGTDGSFLKHGLDPQEQALKEGKLPDMQNWGAEKETQWGFLNTQIQGMHFKGKVETSRGDYSTYYSNIYETIRNKKELIVTAEQANNTIRIIEAAKKSAKQNNTIIL